MGVSIKWRPVRLLLRSGTPPETTQHATGKAELARRGLEGGVLFPTASSTWTAGRDPLDGYAPRLSWDRMHDTMFLVFQNPTPAVTPEARAPDPLRHEPTERDAVREWLIGEGIVTK